MLESLLKNINEIIKRNSKFFEDNPELFKAVEQRFAKAAYDDEEDSDQEWDPFAAAKEGYEDQEDYYDQDTQEQAPQDDEDPDADYLRSQSDQEDDEDLFDMPDTTEDEEDIAQKRAIKEWMSQQKKSKQSAPTPKQEQELSGDQALAQLKQIQEKFSKPTAQTPATPAAPQQEPKLDEDEADEDEIDEDNVIKKPEWTMSPNRYSPEQLKNMMSFMAEGYSSREAEALAGAHEQLPSIEHILRRNMKPSNPSEKMIQALKPHIFSKYGEDSHNRNLGLNPEENPDLHFNANKNQMVGNAMKSKLEAMAEYRANLVAQGMSEDEIEDHMPAFHHKWKKENPGHSEGLNQVIQQVGELQNKNKEARNQRREDVKNALVLAGKGIGGGDDMPSAVVGDTSNIQGGAAMAEAIRQGAGGVKGQDDEAATQLGMQADPHAVMANQPKNKEFMQQLEQQQVGKLVAKLTPEQKAKMSPDMLARLNAVDSNKKRGQ